MFILFLQFASQIIIKKHLLLYKGYKLKCSIGKSGITNSKKEGDLATPKGIFKLGLLYYRKDRNKSLKSKLKKTISMIEKKLLRDQKERSVLFVGFLVIVGTAVMLIP